jgi:gamma-glutamylcyclotransferase (GGCT)/AIG2-like uncharacterized protein YtfP
MMGEKQIVLRTLTRQDDNPPAMTLVFVYGSLMRGFHNYRLLVRGNAHYLGRAETRPEYSLIDLGPFPGLIESGTTRVRGEVYDVDGPTLAHLDRLEGHPKFYQRKHVALARRPHQLRLPEAASRVVWAYFLPNEEYGHRPLIMTGDWKRKESGTSG